MVISVSLLFIVEDVFPYFIPFFSINPEKIRLNIFNILYLLALL